MTTEPPPSPGEDVEVALAHDLIAFCNRWVDERGVPNGLLVGHLSAMLAARARAAGMTRAILQRFVGESWDRTNGQ